MAEMLGKPNDNADEKKYQEWLGIACRFACDLLPYRKPALRAVLSQQIGGPNGLDVPQSREELLQRLEERAGAEGRKLLEQFFRKLDRL